MEYDTETSKKGADALKEEAQLLRQRAVFIENIVPENWVLMERNEDGTYTLHTKDDD